MKFSDKKDFERKIKESHLRSQKSGVRKDQFFSRSILSAGQLESRLQINRHLLEIAGHFLYFFNEFVEHTGAIVVLTDQNGCILKLLGNKDIIQGQQKSALAEGAYLDEKNMGTNAIGMAILEKEPVQISAHENYITAFHQLTCSAAPIHKDGEIIGILGLCERSTKAQLYSLGMVAAVVHSIEDHLKNEETQQDLLEAFKYINSIINTFSFGVLTADLSGKISRINAEACKLLNNQADELVAKNLLGIIPDGGIIIKTLSEGRPFEDKEMAMNSGQKAEKFNISAYAIKNDQGELISILIIFNEIKKIIHLVNKYTGMHAHYTFDDIIGKSKEIQWIIEFAKSVASSPSTILIQGESGTGKEVFAQSIHNASERAENGFVAVNCGAIPESLIESELFGYDEGAFTGAIKGGRPGKFELANGGTLFLDEIGEMPLSMQVKLLRALQENCITRVGSTKDIPVDVRIIAATNKDLKHEVEKGRFRLDLFYRLSVIPIVLPPLKKRIEDIPLFIDFFLNAKSAKLNKAVPQISPALMNEMLTYSWPGNIRELENFIEKTVNLEGKVNIDEHLKEIFPEAAIQKEVPVVPSTETIETLEEIEKRAIQKTLVLSNGNITQAARNLHISRNTLYLKLKKYKLS